MDRLPDRASAIAQVVKVKRSRRVANVGSFDVVVAFSPLLAVPIKHEIAVCKERRIDAASRH